MIDAHLHLQNCIEEVDADAIMASLRRVGVERLMVNATSPNDWERVASLARRFSEAIPSFGVHPWYVSRCGSDWEDGLREMLMRFPAAGVGEIGLDKWIKGYDLALQKEIMMKQLAMAQELGRPVTIHCLQAWGSLLECLQQSRYSGPFLLHSYGGPEEMIADWVELGAYFSLSGYFFREAKAEKLKVFEQVPKDCVLLETDAPDMAFDPEQARYEGAGMANHPANIELVYERYAEWSGAELETVRDQVSENFRQFLER